MKANNDDERRGLERGNPSIDSEASNHEFRLEIKPRVSCEGEGEEKEERPATPDSSSSPFAHDLVQARPMPRGRLTRVDRIFARALPRRKSSPQEHAPRMPSLDERQASTGPISPRSRMRTFRTYRQQIGTRGAFSLELPGMTSRQMSDGVRVSVDMPPGTSAGMDPGIEPAIMGRLVRKRRRLPMGVVIGFGVVSSVCLCVAIATLGIGIYNFSRLRLNRAANSIEQLENTLVPYLANLRDGVDAVQLGVATLLNRTQG